MSYILKQTCSIITFIRRPSVNNDDQKTNGDLSIIQCVGKLCKSISFNTFPITRCIELASLLKKRLRHKSFPLNFAKYLKTPILHNICKRLLLPFHIREYTDQIRLRVLEYYTYSLSHSFPGYTLALKVTFWKILEQQCVHIERLAGRVPGWN